MRKAETDNLPVNLGTLSTGLNMFWKVLVISICLFSPKFALSTDQNLNEAINNIPNSIILLSFSPVSYVSARCRSQFRPSNASSDPPDVSQDVLELVCEDSSHRTTFRFTGIQAPIGTTYTIEDETVEFEFNEVTIKNELKINHVDQTLHFTKVLEEGFRGPYRVELSAQKETTNTLFYYQANFFKDEEVLASLSAAGYMARNP